VLGREFVKRIRLLLGRTETVKTRFELKPDGSLVEHVSLETHDAGAQLSTRSSPSSAAFRTKS
jgi:hypothetical protein